ncbi:trypsin-like peptidase domain-containing protein [Streptomyces sp. NPDC021098]|uniref:nSTAND1 domain-containing NTPase n=1 Tax=unclassified Streptomyces TaxID=2593676 RepID=UPI0037B04179
MTAVREQDVLTAALVRIRTSSGTVVGAGFLVAADVVCTCAHVVARALDLDDVPEEPPADAVALDFPLLRDAEGAVPDGRATVVTWRWADDGSADVALLRLDGPVRGARPVPLVDGTQVWGHGFRVLGYPRGGEQGVWAAGTLRGPQGAGWLQMESEPTGRRVSPGFSGSPVWDEEQGGVVGMTVAVQRGDASTTAYLIPSASLVDERVLRPRCPFRGLSPFREEDEEFFHGREDDARRLRDALDRGMLTVVVGPSGCGKSSLVRAGLLPPLRARGVTVSELRPVPGAPPAAALARTVMPLLEPDAGEVERLRRAAELAALLQGSAAPEPDAVRAPDSRQASNGVAADLGARLAALGGQGGHLLFVDQFEEYAASEPAAARELFGLLIALGGEAGPPRERALRIVVTARPETLDTLVTPHTANVLSDATRFLAPLSSHHLLRAITAPVDAVPGLWFEPGLPERIAADAAEEPGRMPLVEFALTRLWERRSESMLTHATYDALGGVPGALVGYAEDVFRDRVTEAEEPTVRRLFAQLTRPDDSGGFSRLPVRTADLEPELRDLASRLSPTKLVVHGRAPDGEEIVDLAHEALTRLWPRLHRWLVDSQEFRAWQERLRGDLRRWREQGEEPADLLRGGTLATAVDRLARKPEDITPAERHYIELSRRHERRGRRRWRIVTAGLTALVLVAAALSFVAWSGQQRIEQQRRTEASGLLAEAANRRLGSQPATSLQLALAAWRTRGTPQASAALLRQYVRGLRLTGSHPALWPGRFSRMTATPDGRTVVIRSVPERSKRGVVTVVTGLPEGRPRPWRLSGVPISEASGAVSPDGHSYAIGTADGDVRVWDLRERTGPRVLRTDDEAGLKVSEITLDFSSDGRRLLRTLTSQNERRPGFSAWDVRTGRRLPLGRDLKFDQYLSGAAFTADPGMVVLTSVSHEGVRARAELRDLRTGRLVRKVPGGDSADIRGGGELLLMGKGLVSRVLKADRTARHVANAPDDTSTEPDVTAEYTLSPESSDDGHYAQLTLTALRTGKTYGTRVPLSSSVDAIEDHGVGAMARADGTLTVFVAAGDALITARAVPVTLPRHDPGAEATTLRMAPSPDGKRVAAVSGKRLELLPTDEGASRTATPPSASGLPDGWNPSWTADSRRLILWSRGPRRLHVVSTDDPRRGIVLDLAAILPGGSGEEVEAVEPLRGSEVAVLTADGTLVRIDTATGKPLTRPVNVGRMTPKTASDPFASYGQFRARPGHPGQVAVVTRDGLRDGKVQLWDLRARKRLKTLSVGPVEGRNVDERTNRSIGFTRDGERMATENSDNFVRVWDVDQGTVLDKTLPIGANDDLVGFAARDRLVTQGMSAFEPRFTVWDVDTGGSVAEFPYLSKMRAATVGDGRLLTMGDGWFQATDLDPDRAFRRLCAAVGRDFTAAERRLLPPGAPRDAPCS